MEIPGIKEYKNFKENAVKDVRNLFRLNKSVKETNYAASKGIRKLFRLEKEKKKKLKIELLKISVIFLGMMNKIIINQ